MSEKVWIQLGKAGDILSILPLIHDEFTWTKSPVSLMVAKDYASLVSGLDYVNPVIFDGTPSQFKSAYEIARKKFRFVAVPQMHGDVQFANHGTSVFLDMWKRVGMLHKWDTLPLILPRNQTVEKTSRTIFYADHSQSSPFFYREELYKLIQESFPEHNIIRASSMRLKNILDFLPFMDAAELIVSVDTAFLHLSLACNVPVVAMVADKPSHWHGSPWSKRFAIHCRYSEYPTRVIEITSAMNQAVNNFGVNHPKVVKTGFTAGYNATMVGVDKFVYRHHVDGWKTKLAIQDGDTAEMISMPPDCFDFSIEDPRAFSLNGKKHLAYTCSREIDGKWFSIQAYGPMDGARVTKHIVPKYTGNDFSRMEKNWCPFEHDGKLFFIFGNLIKTMEQLVIQVDGENVVKEFKSPAPQWHWGGIRGGAIVQYKGQLVRFFHSRTGKGHKHYEFRYHIGASVMEMEPPFKTVMVSSFPILSGNEKPSLDGCKQWKPNCALPYGASVSGDTFTISGGLNDCEVFKMDLKWKDLNL